MFGRRHLPQLASHLAGPFLFGLLALGMLFTTQSHGLTSDRAEEQRGLESLEVAFETPLLVPKLEAHLFGKPEGRSFAGLPPLHIFTLNNHDEATVRLYDEAGELDPNALQVMYRLLGDVRKPDRPRFVEIDKRVIQLMFRAAYHFHAHQVVIISGYRERGKHREQPHSEGRAIDFRLPGVKLAKLAQYLRTLPRAGVGMYVHPEAQYVHLDSRDQSFHWVDGSPPGRAGAAQSLNDTLPDVDASYLRSMDWPEHIEPPEDLQ